MPAIVTCKGTCLENRWNVAGDDFLLPAFIAVVVGLFNFALISAVILALYYIPSPSDSVFPPCFNITYPPILYAPLFSLEFIEVAFIFSEGLFIVFAAHGPILKNTPSQRRRQKVMPILIYIRGSVAFFELAAIVGSLVGVYHSSVTSLQEHCEELIPRLELAQAVMWLQVLLFVLFLVKLCIYTDPLGISTPGLLEKLKMLDETDNRGSWLEVSADHTPGVDRLFQPTTEPLMLANEVNIWTKKRPIIFRLNEHDLGKVTQVHNDSVSRQNYERRLRAIFCCLGVKGHKARGAALEDVARGLYTVFSETDVVLSDVIAGFALLRNHQREQKKKGGEIALTRKFRMATFKMMPLQQRVGFAPSIIREDFPFDLNITCNQQLLQNLIHYMHYAMGIYGWPLHVFDNIACGLCQLCSTSCCRFRCMHKRVKDDEFLNDNICMCGVGTFRRQTGVKEEDILYVNFENKIYLAPFIVCLDHKMKAVVVCVRGTLSFKDALTDMSFSPIHKKVSGIKETYLHGGMYRAAVGILNTLRKKQLLTTAFKKHINYQLVVTGHSLGAGVASILALLLKQELKYSDDLIKCYAFSPPGSLFSFPLAEYCKSFITTVVLGNDIVPRLTLRGLLFLKLSIEAQLRECRLPKYRILLCKKRRRCSHLFCCCCQGDREDEEEPAQEKYRGIGDDLPPSSPAEATSEVGQDNVDGGDAMEQSIQIDDSLEWQVLNQGTTTASIRKKLFKRSISVHPDKLPSYSRPFSRQQTSVNFRTQQSVATATFAKKLRKAVSLDFDSEVFPDGAIQGTEEVDFPVFDGNSSPNIQETTFTLPTEHAQIVISKDFKHTPSSQDFESVTSLTQPSITSHLHSTSPEPITSSLQDSDLPLLPSSSPSSSSSSPKPSATFPYASDLNLEIAPQSTEPRPSPPRPKSLSTYATLLNEDQPGKDSASSKPKQTREVKLVRLASSHYVKTKEETEEVMDRERTMSDATPGGVLDSTVPKLLEHCYADERKLFMPFFMPGRVLHLQVKKNNRWCDKDKLVMTEAYRENLCVILVDNGMIDDHLPNYVLAALKAYKLESGITFNHEEIEREREKQAILRARIRRVSESMTQSDGFIFVAGSPVSDDSSSSDTSIRRSHFKKQQSFELSMGTRPPLAGKNSLNVVERSSAGLRRISECTEEESASARVLPENVTTAELHQNAGYEVSNVNGTNGTRDDLTTWNRNQIEADSVDGGTSSRGGTAGTRARGVAYQASNNGGTVAVTNSKISLLERRKFPSGGLKINISGDCNTSMDAWLHDIVM